MLVDIKLRHMPNSGPWGPHMTRVGYGHHPYRGNAPIDSGVLVSPVNSPMLKSFNYMRSINTGRYLIQILIKFLVECHRNHVWGPIFDPCYDHFHKCEHFG